MRKGFAALLTAASLIVGTAALAADVSTPSHIEGSHQGGYLGINPGAQAPSAPAAAPQVGSLQGGYLGKNPGATNQPQRPAGAIDASSKPTAWCDAYSLEPDRCRGRADVDHQICAGKADAAHYVSCRRGLDYMGWRP